MVYDWIAGYCLDKPGVTEDYKIEWKANRYQVGGKMFAMIGGDKTGKPILTVKLEPLCSELLRGEYPKWIVPGYYMNKEHWSSLYLEEAEITDLVVKTMLDQGYDLALKSLPKKEQDAILRR